MNRFIGTTVSTSLSVFLASVAMVELSGCGSSASSFTALPNLAQADVGGQSDDWRTPRTVWHGIHERPVVADPSATPSAEVSSTPSATASPTATPGATATASPKPTAVATPTASPQAPTTPYNPPAGTYPLFPSSVFHQTLPANPTVNANNAAWLATLGQVSLGGVQFAQNAAGAAQDYTFPIYPMSPGNAGSVPVTVHCTEPWGTCNVEGKTIYVDPRESPEGGADAHMAFVDGTHGVEYDFWGTKWPPAGGVLTANWGGECSTSGNGYTGCPATASNTPISEGIIRVSDVMLAIQNDGSLPYALQAQIPCTDGEVAPFTASDGHTAGCPPEGERVYLAMHDAAVDASAESPIAKAILRTIDEDHYGMILTDRSGGNGISLQWEDDTTYTAFGQPGPLVNTLIPEAQAEGLQGTIPYDGVYYLQIPFTGVDLADNLKFM